MVELSTGQLLMVPMDLEHDDGGFVESNTKLLKGVISFLCKWLEMFR